MDTLHSEVLALLDSRSNAIWEKDLEQLMSHYTHDVIYYDLVPPLQYVGSAALRERFRHWFDGFQGPIGQEFHDLTILGNDDVAVAACLIRASGTLHNGVEVAQWVRGTSGCQRTDYGWRITHEHISLPVDTVSGQGVKNLVP